MNIPDKAVEAAVNARGRLNNPKWDNDIWGFEQFSEDQKAFLRGEARAILEAAAPFIAAQAWQDGYDTGTREPGWDGYNDEPWDDTGDRRTCNPYNGKYPR